MAALVILVAAPWLNPYAGGPSATVMPLLVTYACMALLLLSAPAALPGFALPILAAAAWAWTALGSAGALSADTVGAGAAAVCLLAAVSVGRAAAGNEALRLTIACGWLAAGIVSAAMGLLQFFGAEHHFGRLISAAGEGQAFGNLRQRNQFASLMSLSLAVLVWGGLRARAMAGARPWLACAAAVLLAIAAAASASRTGLAQLAVLTALLALWKGRGAREAWLVIGMAWIAYLGAAFLLPGVGVFERMSAEGAACASRLTLWGNVRDLIAMKPWTGWGWGELDYAHFATLYAAPRFCDILDNAHNLPLHIAVELGVPAAVFACAAALAFLLRRAPWRETSGARQLAWAIVAIILVHSMLEYPLWYGPFQIAFGVCLGLLVPRDGEPVARPLGQGARVALAGVMAIAVGIAAWDYRRVSQVYLPPDARAQSYREDAMGEARKSLLFRNQALFAELTLAPLTRANAEVIHAQALALLHYSPEPRVVEKLVESSTLLGRDEEALAWLVRYKAAFPEDYGRWRKSGVLGLSAGSSPQAGKP